MKFETPMYSDGIVKSKQTVFGGLNHNPGAGDGQIYEMRNMCSDYYPLLATRPRRKLIKDVAIGAVLSDGDDLYSVRSGSVYRNETKIGTAGGLISGERTLAKLNNYLLIFPSKVYYDAVADSMGNMDQMVSIQRDSEKVYESEDTTVITGENEIEMTFASFVTGVTPLEVGEEIVKKYKKIIIRHETYVVTWVQQWVGEVTSIEGDVYTIAIQSGNVEPIQTGTIQVWRSSSMHTISFQDGTLYGESAVQNTIYCSTIDWSDYFNAGDAVEISGSDITENNKTIIVREVEEHELRFYEYSFTNGTETGETFQIKRQVPDFDGMFVSGNRLWGWKGKTIYASKLGDPFNFNVFDGLDTDSWTAEVGGCGEFTGGIEYQGYPIFFREWDLFKVYGYMPSNFELIRTAETGVKEGCGKSLAIAGETLFYYNQNGVYAYSGGMPAKISAGFGLREYKECSAGSDGQKYYLNACEKGKSHDDIKNWHLFVYDTVTGLWHVEDELKLYSSTIHKGQFLCAIWTKANYGGQEKTRGIYAFGRTYYETENLEDNFDWYVEFTDFTDDSPNKKDFKRLQIRLELDEDTADPPWVKAKLMMDSDGEWIEPEGGTIEDPEKRSYLMTIIPRRADHYRLRLEGHGGCRIYSIAREFSEGSDLKSVKGRQ